MSGPRSQNPLQEALPSPGPTPVIAPPWEAAYLSQFTNDGMPSLPFPVAPFALSSTQLSAPITVQHSYHVTNESRDCDVSGLLTLLPKICVSPSARKGKFLAVTKFLYDQSLRAASESKGAPNVLS